MEKYRVEETSSTTVTITYKDAGSATGGSPTALELDRFGRIFHDGNAVVSIDARVGGTDSKVSILVTAQAGNNNQVVVDVVSFSNRAPSSPTQASPGGVTWSPTSSGGQVIDLTAPTISGYEVQYSLQFIGLHEPPVKLPVTVLRT